MSIIGFIIFGLVIGLLARAIYPGRQHMGWLATAILGMIGSLVGGLIGHALFGGNSQATQLRHDSVHPFSLASVYHSAWARQD